MSDHPRGIDGLVRCVASRRIKGVRAALANGVNVNGVSTMSYQGWTALFVAAFHPVEEIMDFLLRKGASPHARDLQQRTPLHVSAERGAPVCVQQVQYSAAHALVQLIEAGADVNLFCGVFWLLLCS
jgi:hypothetical protein